MQRGLGLLAAIGRADIIPTTERDDPDAAQPLAERHTG